ncbi:extracellular matrix protein 2 [Epinephelus moara]|uniref:extracellular matrix protein 2 n=1 Tax=Epinephelus moara TaxID=300413 RepID=UPI00214E647C|nr:extracellular matrix protein 2 [Epinephelus moara]XP_049892685.1 extracellular matrix protein 2 [Epinephelus moara]
MEVLTLLLIFLTVSGHSYVLQPSLTVTQMAGLDRDHESDMRSEQLHDPSISVKEKENAAESTERMKTDEEEQTSEGLTPETNPEKEERMAPETFLKSLGEVTERGEFSAAVTDLDTNKEVERIEDGLNVVSRSESVKAIPTGNTETLEKVDQIDKLKQEKVEEEREGKLVAGIHLQEEIRGESMQTVNHENVADKGGNGEKEGHMVISNLAPPVSTSSTQLGEESVIPATIQIITQSQNPPGSPPPVHQHNVPPSPTQVPPVSSHPPVPYDKVSPPNPTTISHMPTVLPGESRSVFLLEDLLTEVLQNPLLKQNQLDVKASPNLEDVMAKNILFKPARKEQQTIIVQPKEAEFIPEVPAATPKPKAAKFITKDLKEPNPRAKSTVKPKPNMSQPAAKPKTLKLMENDTKLTVKQNKSPPPQPQLTKPSARPRLAAAKTPSTRPTKINRSSKNKTIKKSKEKKRKKDNKTQKPSERKKKVIAPTHFPYFKDNYCPPECACYGRVVQCSDKGVDKVPYGIPYNARYILLMNNHIDMIQLDLLNEYVAMEFLVLSNNQLTDGAIEGAFEGIPALKRLYLDRNLLNSVPTDLPVSLEELRLDSNQLSVMSEAAWARCPGLLVLSLSNNSLGNGSESLPDGVLAPLGNLRTLNLDHNQLTSVPLGLPLSIKELYIRGNIIEQFRSGAFDGISDLVLLDLSANRLTNKGLLRDSLLNTTHLESLNLAGNRLKQVPRHLPRSLKTLNLEGNLISSIKKATFGALKNLEHLGLARNKIFKVAPGAFRTLPALHQLDLCHNTLRQVPRQLPEALHSVALTHNKIESVPRDAFCWGNNSLSGLVRVQLEHNLMDMGRLDAQAFRCLRGFQVVHFY